MSSPLEPDREQALTRLFAQNAKHENALGKAREERDRLDRMIAEYVSSEPTSPMWYAKPGVVTIDDVVSVITGGVAAVHHALERYRKVTAAARKPRAKTSRKASR